MIDGARNTINSFCGLNFSSDFDAVAGFKPDACARAWDPQNRALY
jgi:hypothetical protein